MEKRKVISYKTYMKDINELQNNFEKTKQEFESYKQKQESIIKDAKSTNEALSTKVKALLDCHNKLKLSYDKINNKFKTTFIGLTISLILNIVLLILCLI